MFIPIGLVPLPRSDFISYIQIIYIKYKCKYVYNCINMYIYIPIPIPGVAKVPGQVAETIEQKHIFDDVHDLCKKTQNIH